MENWSVEPANLYYSHRSITPSLRIQPAGTPAVPGALMLVLAGMGSV
jgi:hypothetical protein